MTPRDEAYIVLPESRSNPGVTWGPFTLDDARAFVRDIRRGDGFIVLAGDEHQPNPPIWNYADACLVHPPAADRVEGGTDE